MLYLLAAIGAVAIGVVLWRLLQAEHARVPDTGDDETEHGRRPAAGRRVVGPDDDPEFLRSLDNRDKPDS